MKDTKELSQEPIKEIVIGQHKTKRKFLNFITGLRGRVRLNNNVAFLKGEKLSGMLEGVVFKITICDENTINFEEIGETNLSNPEMISRFIDDIDKMDVTGYTQKYVISGLDFYDENNNVSYLEVEQKKPIEMLYSIFEEGNKEISQNSLSLLDELLGSVEDKPTQEEEVVEVEKEEVVDKPVENEAQKMLRESFENMNSEKVLELKERIEKTESEISKLKHEIRQSEAKVTSSVDSLKVLNSRLASLHPKDAPIGYDFFVSEEIKTDIVPDENLVKVVEKISPILKLNSKVVIDMLTKGCFNIKVKSQKDEKITYDIIRKISTIDPQGTVTQTEQDQFTYRGEMSWHQLVDKMIRMGFEQNPEFDKISGSNSYESKEEVLDPKEDAKEESAMDRMKGAIVKMAEKLGIKSVAEQHIKNIENDVEENEEEEFKFKDLISFDEPTDIVIYGHNEEPCEAEFSITDDESSFELYKNGEPNTTLGSFGFGSVITLEEYKKVYSANKETFNEMDGVISGVIVRNFKGTIGIAAVDSDGELSTDFDLDDYIQHQFDDHMDVVINIPGNPTIVELNEDLSLPVAILRDIKIDDINS